MSLYISVIIATKDRADALDKISLPSLLKQGGGFEVLIWDASSNDSSEKIASTFAPKFSDAGVEFRYAKAPRAGLASQRNDAMREAKGDIFFFIDDDSEISENGVKDILFLFEKDKDLLGASLPLRAHTTNMTKHKRSVIYRFARAVMHIFQGDRSRRRIARSIENIMPKEDVPGPAEWLTGCSMALRANIAKEERFDERLQKFGGYALGEDVDMTHRVYLRTRKHLVVSPSGYVIHHSATGGRPDRARWMASIFYNSKILRENFIRSGEKHPLISFLWGQRVCAVLRAIIFRYPIGDIINGYREYRRSLINY